jgi:hypothetical protein
MKTYCKYFICLIFFIFMSGCQNYKNVENQSSSSELSGCAELKNSSDIFYFPVLKNEPPTKIELHAVNDKTHKSFVMELNGNFLYGETDSIYHLEPVFVKKYTREDYIKLLELSKKVIINDYRSTKEDNSSPANTVYQLTLGEAWNSFSVRILVDDENKTPIELKELIDYLNFLNKTGQ